jgi:hypothetical protein
MWCNAPCHDEQGARVNDHCNSSSSELSQTSSGWTCHNYMLCRSLLNATAAITCNGFQQQDGGAMLGCMPCLPSKLSATHSPTSCSLRPLACVALWLNHMGSDAAVINISQQGKARRGRASQGKLTKQQTTVFSHRWPWVGVMANNEDHDLFESNDDNRKC